jgi:hypothetical protein
VADALPAVPTPSALSGCSAASSSPLPPRPRFRFDLEETPPAAALPTGVAFG